MKTLTIAVTMSEVMDEVSKTSSYIGAKALTQDGGNQYDNLAVMDEQEELLKRFWKEACAGVMSIGKEFVTSFDDTSDIFEVEYSLPDNYNNAMDTSAQRLAFSYAVEYVLAKWLETCNAKDMADGHANMATAMAEQLGNVLYARTFSRAKEGYLGSNDFGDNVQSFAGTDGDDSDETEGNNTFGDDVQSTNGTSGDTDDEEENATNTFGDDVQSTNNSDGDTDDEGENATNTFGDDVQSTNNSDGDTDEKERDNTIGGVFPQGFGEINIERYTYTK